MNETSSRHPLRPIAIASVNKLLYIPRAAQAREEHFRFTVPHQIRNHHHCFCRLLPQMEPCTRIASQHHLRELAHSPSPAKSVPATLNELNPSTHLFFLLVKSTSPRRRRVQSFPASMPEYNCKKLNTSPEIFPV